MKAAAGREPPCTSAANQVVGARDFARPGDIVGAGGVSIAGDNRVGQVHSTPVVQPASLGLRRVAANGAGSEARRAEITQAAAT